MLTKKIVLAAIAGTALFSASGVYARDDHRHGYRHQGHHYGHAKHRVVVRPAPVYYYYYHAPVPVYYVPPRPVLFGTLPLGDARLRIGFQF